MNLVAAAVLGAVQGLTEFLPVSSSAHLILARAFFGWDAGRLGLPFDVAVHIGTLVAVVIYFWRDLFGMVRAVPRAFAASPDADGRRIWLVVAGTVPVVLVGLFLWSDDVEHATRTPLVAAVTLFVGAGLALRDRADWRAHGRGRAADGARGVWYRCGTDAGIGPRRLAIRRDDRRRDGARACVAKSRRGSPF